MNRDLSCVAVLAFGLGLSAPSARAETTQCTVITAAPYTITTQGIYCLADDLKVGLAIGPAIEIAANNVVLDLNGHRLTNSGGTATQATGVYAAQRQNIVVKNGTVQGFWSAVNFQFVVGAVIERIRSDRSLHTGINANSESVIVRDNLILNTGGWTGNGANADAFGVVVAGAANHVLHNDIVTVTKQGSGNAYGIYFIPSVSLSLAAGNRVSGAERAIVAGASTGVKYRDTLSTGIALTPYLGGVNAGNNN